MSKVTLYYLNMTYQSQRRSSKEILFISNIIEIPIILFLNMFFHHRSLYTLQL
jgi:hypothetical protein